MKKQSVDVYIAGRHFKINHENPDYVLKAASIVDSKFNSAVKADEETDRFDSLILACLDICDDMLAARTEIAKLLAQAKGFAGQLEEKDKKISELEKELDRIKRPQFIIPMPQGSGAEIPSGQLSFPNFDSRIPDYTPAVNDLTVANMHRRSKKAAK